MQRRLAPAVMSVLLATVALWTQAVRAQERVLPDTIAQRVQACSVCHGEQGRATSAGYFPRIAGKPAGYLYNQLLNFRDGRRTNGVMTYLVDQLSDDYLREIAEYFSRQDLPYPPPQKAEAPAAVLARGETLVRRGDAALQLPACAQCHGAALTGVLPAVPGLLGLPRDYLTAQLGAWRTGQRQARAPDCMHTVASRLTGQDVSALAQWLAAQTPPANGHPAERLPAPMPLECGSGAKP